jgi:hypothetical protein
MSPGNLKNAKGKGVAKDYGDRLVFLLEIVEMGCRADSG